MPIVQRMPDDYQPPAVLAHRTAHTAEPVDLRRLQLRERVAISMWWVPMRF